MGQFLDYIHANPGVDGVGWQP